jgi:hypothetical protein
MMEDCGTLLMLASPGEEGELNNVEDIGMKKAFQFENIKVLSFKESFASKLS